MKFYEDELPEGYTEALALDADDKKPGQVLKIATLIINVLSFCAIRFFYIKANRSLFSESFSAVKIVCLSVGFVAAYILYIAAHELTHGAVYKIFTKKKLVINFKPPVAYCGVPDVYTYRITSLFSLFAPLVLFGALFASLFFISGDPFIKTFFLVLLALHISGCVGDIYGVGILLFKFRDGSTLRKDTGPKMIYYTKES